MESREMLQRTSAEIANNCMLLIREGHVRDHVLLNHAREHTGEPEAHEMRVFRDFLVSKNGCILMELQGSEIYD